jgi:pimeloyl-ACP methyl ester carboxylesterase
MISLGFPYQKQRRGKNDFFLPPGAEAFKRDIPNATVRFFDTGHFALETHGAEIAAAILEFFPR